MDISSSPSADEGARVPVHVEVVMRETSTSRHSDIETAVAFYLEEHTVEFVDGVVVVDDAFLAQHVKKLRVTGCAEAAQRAEEQKLEPVSAVDGTGGASTVSCSGAFADSGVSFFDADLFIHVFQLSDEGPSDEVVGDDSGECSACTQWVLPAIEFDGMWDTYVAAKPGRLRTCSFLLPFTHSRVPSPSPRILPPPHRPVHSLIFDSSIKNSLLEYASTAMHFADCAVNPDVVSWNRVVLLHGPPGTGKTSLCKALAHKLAIRLSHRYPNGALVEINAHSLFSKWFSESGKLVMRLFEHITEMVADDDAFVCVLIDEVESLTAARKSAMAGTEPSDAIRVVNALLTQLDALKRHPNVIVLTTSNITGAIDLAFVDRADIKQFIPLPSHAARYGILRSCVRELMRVGVIAIGHASGGDGGSSGSQQGCAGGEESTRAGQQQSMTGGGHASSAGARMDRAVETLLPFPSFEQAQRTAASGGATASAAMLLSAAGRAEGLSGRALRKLPFQAHAFFVQKPRATEAEFLAALEKAVAKELACRDQLESG